MFFLLRTAFWLSLVIMLIPADDAAGDRDQTHLSALQALGAAQQTYVDMTRFCERNAAACDTGGAALEAFGAKARTGARMIYQYLDPDGRSPETETASQAPADATATAGIRATDPAGRFESEYPAATASAPGETGPSVDTGTLTARDREPIWMPPLPRDKPA